MIISSTKINQLVIISLFLPTLLHHFTSFPNLDPFTPRALIHSRTWIPFFTSSWSPPPDLSSLVSRLSQLCLISLLPAHMLGWGYLYLLFLAGTRTLVGYIFSRSVGWAYPPLFSHWALYESSSGVGPARLASLIMGGQENILERMPERAKELGSLMMVPCLTMAFCWLEGSPWTYGISTILILILVVAKTVYGYRRSRTGYTIAPDTPSSTISTNENEDEKSTYDFTTSTPFRTSLYSLGLALLTILIPYFIISIIIPPFRLPFPLSTSPDRPMLDMIILSYPRPVDILLGTRIINQTISSFLPFISPNQITLSIFTHSTSHPALHQAQLDFSHSDISFYRGTDSHPGYSDNHYLHLSEVFRWAYEKDNKAEWIMLIEDDFPVCNGNDGWVVISTVMAMLESRRLGGMDIGEIDIGSGMIGTGGSGLIIHHTRLRLLSHLLHTYSSLDLLPAGIHHPPPDVLIQDCLIGRLGGICERDEGDKGKMIISSRLVLDHIGGMATTTPGKMLNSDKWRCGWRSGLHGEDGVDVVVV